MAMVVVVAVMVPAMPTMMAVVPPMHFSRRQPGIFLNHRSGAGIAERQRIGALGWSCERQQRADGGEPKNFRDKNFRKLHACSPCVGVTPAPNRSPQRCTQSDVRDLNGF
jgi:hypothetical protein